ncbi:MAG: hypothetical protein WD668_01405, partial [Saccharospirillum sp.]
MTTKNAQKNDDTKNTQPASQRVGSGTQRALLALPDVHPPAWIKRVLDQADVRVQGDRPWDLQVYDPRLYGRLLRHGSVGLAESYVDGWWSSYR